MFPSVCLLSFAFCFLSLASSQATLGSVTVSTEISCDEPGYRNLTLQPDTCHSSGSTGQGSDFDRTAYHVLRLQRFAACANGSSAPFVIYTDPGCREVDRSYDAEDVLDDGQGYEGLCLGLIEFRSVAFVCDGVNTNDTGNEPVLSTLTSVLTMYPAAISSMSATGESTVATTVSLVGGGPATSSETLYPTVSNTVPTQINASTVATLMPSVSTPIITGEAPGILFAHRLGWTLLALAAVAGLVLY